MRCPDCDGDSKDLFEEKGDGICSTCHGNGIGGLMDEFAESTNPFGPGHITCDNCGGSGKCPSCEASGYA